MALEGFGGMLLSPAMVGQPKVAMYNQGGTGKRGGGGTPATTTMNGDQGRGKGLHRKVKDRKMDGKHEVTKKVVGLSREWGLKKAEVLLRRGRGDLVEGAKVRSEPWRNGLGGN